MKTEETDESLTLNEIESGSLIDAAPPITGPYGMQGIQGMQGVVGPDGPVGIQGVAGSMGIQGLDIRDQGSFPD